MSHPTVQNFDGIAGGDGVPIGQHVKPRKRPGRPEKSTEGLTEHEIKKRVSNKAASARLRQRRKEQYFLLEHQLQNKTDEADRYRTDAEGLAEQCASQHEYIRVLDARIAELEYHRTHTVAHLGECEARRLLEESRKQCGALKLDYRKLKCKVDFDAKRFRQLKEDFERVKATQCTTPPSVTDHFL